MTTSGEPHPAAEGLLGSGYVVSMVRQSTPIEAHIGDDLICVVLPGTPCKVLIAFHPQAAESFAAMLNEQIRAFADRQDQQR